MAEQGIALIGAGSALAGVLVTGVFTLLKGRQDRLDKQMDRDEQRRNMHREARKGAYASLLAAYYEVERKMGEVAKVRSGVASEPVALELPIAEAAIVAIGEAASAVALEGPVDVAAEAQRLYRACFNLLAAYAVLANGGTGDEVGTRLWAYESPERDARQEEVKRSRLAFLESARAVLGGNDPGLR
ncbi:hypothetical protein [Streptomyces sp. NPDC056512]|uniref:hypothetical protein n=1 Tax=Streptomyces sp. NPDC056512 TaxID=3345846 RepID=UPI0036C81C2F